MDAKFNLDEVIRKVPGFPKPGVLFYDITSVLMNSEAFSYCIDSMIDYYRNSKIDAIAAVEARGFLFAAPFAEKMGLPIILVRKKGKLPGTVLSKTFLLEYGEDTVEIHKDDIEIGKNILIIDDLIATGGTIKAAAELLQEAGGVVKDIFSVIGLPFLKYEEVLSGYKIKTLIDYHGE